MAKSLHIASHYLPLVTAEAAANPLASPALRMAGEGDITVIYAPFDHIAQEAKLVVVGITPGLTQATNALHAALGRGELSLEQRLQAAKQTASFSGGAIRSNLIAMLDSIGVARHFRISSSADLFRPGSGLVHFTSALRYPVFVKGKNYNGMPDMIRTPLLRKMIETHLVEEACALPDALWLPLGPKAEQAVLHLSNLGHLRRDRILSGLPHPSGANAERVAVFLGRKASALASRQTNAAALLEASKRLSMQVQNLGTAQGGVA